MEGGVEGEEGPLVYLMQSLIISCEKSGSRSSQQCLGWEGSY